MLKKTLLIHITNLKEQSMKKFFTIFAIFAMTISLTAQTCTTTATWNGSSWSIPPTASTNLVFNGNCIISTNLSGCSATVNSGNVSIASGYSLTLQNSLTVVSGTFTVETDANLVQINSASNTGSIKVKRSGPLNLRLDYALWSSPVSNQNLATFSPVTVTNRFYTYTSSTDFWNSVANVATTNFTIGQSVLIRTPNNWSATVPAKYPGVFNGVPFNGSLAVPINTTYTAIGNPYPSAIDADLFLANANNVANGITTLYFWSHTLSNAITGSNKYATYNATGGVASSAPAPVPDGKIQVAQGFLVNCTAAGTANFENSMRISSTAGQFFKVATVEKNRYWLNVTGPDSRSCQLLVGYLTDANTGYDQKFDAAINQTIPEANSFMYTFAGTTKTNIQGRSLPFNYSDIVQVGLNAAVAGQYTVQLGNVDGIFIDNQTVLFRDKLNYTIDNLKNGSVTFYSAAGVYDTRFELSYQTVLSSQSITSDVKTFIIKDATDLTIESNESFSSIRIYDTLGKSIYVADNCNSSIVKINLSMLPVNQLIVVKTVSASGKTSTNKLIL